MLGGGGGQKRSDPQHKQRRRSRTMSGTAGFRWEPSNGSALTCDPPVVLSPDEAKPSCFTRTPAKPLGGVGGTFFFFFLRSQVISTRRRRPRKRTRHLPEAAGELMHFFVFTLEPLRNSVPVVVEKIGKPAGTFLDLFVLGSYASAFSTSTPIYASPCRRKSISSRANPAIVGSWNPPGVLA